VAYDITSVIKFCQLERAMKRRTKQREIILTTLEQAIGPLTADEIWKLARAYRSNIGKATIYRNLRMLVQEDDIKEVHLPNESTRFELSFIGHRHYFYCEQCKKISFIQATCPVAALDGVTLPSGYKIRSHNLMFYGICMDCNDQ